MGVQQGQGVNHRPVRGIVGAEGERLQDQREHTAVVMTVGAAQAGMNRAPVGRALGAVFPDERVQGGFAHDRE